MAGQLEQRHGDLVVGWQAGNKAAVERLVAAIGDGGDLPLSSRTDAAAAAAEGAANEVELARDVLQQIEAKLAAARTGLVGAVRAVRVAAYGLDVGHAVVEAEAIEVQAAALNARRIDLWGLSVALTTEARSLGPSGAGRHGGRRRLRRCCTIPKPCSISMRAKQRKRRLRPHKKSALRTEEARAEDTILAAGTIQP